MKKILFLLAFFWATVTFVFVSPSLAHADPITQETGVAARANVVGGDDKTSPNPFKLISPIGRESICSNRPTYTWEVATDNIGISHYSFKVWSISPSGERRQFYFFDRLPPQTTLDQSQNGFNFDLNLNNTNQQLSLFVYSDLETDPELQYYWEVIAFDFAGNSRLQQTDFSYRPDCGKIDCSDLVATPQIIQPAGTITTSRPALVFSFNPSRNQNVNDFNFTISVDGVDRFVGLTAQDQQTSDYQLFFNPNGNIFSLQFAVDLWTPSTIVQNSTHDIQIKANYRNCNTSSSRQIIYSGGSANVCEQNLARPNLYYPANGSNLSQPPSYFSWSVCLPESCVPVQRFYLNGHLTPVLVGNQGYYSITTKADASDGNCSGILTTYTLSVSDYGPELPLLNNQRNTWGIRLGNELFTSDFNFNADDLPLENEEEVKSGLNESGEICSWCSVTNKFCATGPCSTCQALGKTCFKHLEDARNCQLNPDIACSDQPNSWAGVLDSLGLSGLSESWNSLTKNLAVNLSGFATQVFPSFSLVFALPFGIFMLFYALKKGLVFSSSTAQGVGKCLVILEKEIYSGPHKNKKEFIGYSSQQTDVGGRFSAFKIENTGNYRLRVISTDAKMPSLYTKRSKLISIADCYLGETLRLKAGSEFTAMIPVDISPVSKKNKYWLWPHLNLIFLRFWRNFSWLAGIMFGLNIIFFLIYPTALNLAILFVYLLIIVRRLISTYPSYNLDLLLVNELGVAQPNISLHFFQTNFEKTIVRSFQIQATDKNGRYHSYLPAGEYELSFPYQPCQILHRDHKYAQITYRVKPHKLNKSTLYIEMTEPILMEKTHA